MARRSRIARVLSVAVAVVCVAWAILIFCGVFFAALQPTYRQLFGTIVALYGIYRLVLGVRPRES